MSRPSRNGAELSKAEMVEGAGIVEEKVREWRPEAVCIVGKGIWETMFRVKTGKVLREGRVQVRVAGRGVVVGEGKGGRRVERSEDVRGDEHEWAGGRA